MLEIEMLQQPRRSAATLSDRISGPFIEIADTLACRWPGFDYRFTETEIELCRDWIRLNCQPRLKINSRWNSALGARAAVEQATGHHIFEASFIVAALDLGYDARVVSRHCYFNMVGRRPEVGHGNGDGR